jgi:hypothetical protein
MLIVIAILVFMPVPVHSSWDLSGILECMQHRWQYIGL